MKHTKMNFFLFSVWILSLYFSFFSSFYGQSKMECSMLKHGVQNVFFYVCKILYPNEHVDIFQLFYNEDYSFSFKKHPKWPFHWPNIQ